MNTPSLHLVQTFVAVVEHHSFVRAASALGITPSSVSRFIKMLEQELSTTLLNRTTRAMSLTETGKRYYAECHQALLQLNNAAGMVRDEQTLPYGVLVVSAPVAFGHTHIVPYLSEFLATCPQVQLDLRLTDDYVDLVSEGIMLAFRVGRLKDSSLIAHKMLDNRRILVAAPAYLKKRGTPLSAEDLHEHECIVSSASQDGVLWRLFLNAEGSNARESNGEERILAPKGSVKVDNADAARRLCIDGQGIAFHSAVTMAAAIAAGDLVQVLPQWTGRETGVYCVRPNRRTGPAAKALLDFLAGRWQRP